MKKLPKIDPYKKKNSTKKGLIIALCLLLIVGIFLTLLHMVVHELFADHYISKILLKDNQAFIIHTSLYRNKSFYYTNDKLLLLDKYLEQSKSIDLDRNVKKVFTLDNGFAFLSLDDRKTFERVIKVNITTFQSEIIDQDFLTKNHFPQGIGTIEYSEMSQLLKVTDIKGFVSFIDFYTFKNYGKIVDEKDFRDKNQKLEQVEEVINESNVMYHEEVLFRMDHLQRRRKIYKSSDYASSMDFLDGKFLGFSLKHKKLLVLSFEDTEHTKFYIHCLDMDLKQLWQKSSSDLDIAAENAKFTSFAMDSDKIYMSFGEEFVVFNASTGDLIKKSSF